MKAKVKIITLFIILISIVSLSYCHKNDEGWYQGTPPTHVKIDESKKANVSFTLTESVEVLSSAYPRISVSHDQDVIVYTCNSLNKNEKSKLVAKTYNKNLEFIGEKSFEYGQGPGDVGAANIVTVTKNKRYISENSNARVSVYDNNWKFETCIQYNTKISETDAFELYNGGTLAVIIQTNYIDDQKRSSSFELVSFPDLDIKTLARTDIYKVRKESEGRQKLIIGGNEEFSKFCKNNEVYILACAPYRILKFDLSGKKLKDIIVDIAKIKTDHSMDGEYLRQFGFSESQNKNFTYDDTVTPAVFMMPLSKGIVVVRRYNYSSECSDWVDGDYFSDNLDYIGRIKIPPSYNVLSIKAGRNNERLKYDNGFLYQIQEKDENFFIEKWKVTE